MPIRSAAGELLRQLTHVQTNIHTIVNLSLRVELGAINARLAARQAGARASGFRVVVSELAGFSQQLERLMESLEKAVYQAVRIGAVMQRQARQARLLAKAARVSGNARMHSAAETFSGCMDVSHWQQRQSRQRVSQELARVRAAVEAGRVSARLARIEAAYGGAFAAVMEQAAAEIESTVSMLQDTLGQLEKQFQEEAA